MAKKRERKLTITQQIMQTATEKLTKYQNDVTRKMYARQVKRYIKFCREHFNVRTFDACKEYIQEYSTYLQSENYTASTIHTYLAAVCVVFEINLATIDKPIRHVSDYVRGRSIKNVDSKNDLDNPEWHHIVEFQRKVGIRRAELMRLQGSDFVCDESGYFCVRVKRGKGGKMQYQRVLEKDVAFIKHYFDSVEKDEYIFCKKYFENNLNFHKLRAESAKEYYWEQLKRIQENSEYAEQLEKEIRLRWERMNLSRKGTPKKFKEIEIRGVYVLRGKNRELALKKGLPIHYDKLALLSTSIFKLSHWRGDVTVASYMLA